jgi:protein tyrosine phosphatase (PTP) superfamily phosphohydrolase (DUF442 family)
MRLLTTTLFLLALACHVSPVHTTGPAASPPLALVVSAYEAAAHMALPESTPEEHPDLPNLFVLSPNIISGGEPQSRAGFELLAERGVKTILSVDGKVPDAKTAAELGMRYVHIPIQYRGIKPSEILRIAKTFRELEAPFFVHCFHGRHRGPAVAALGRVVLDGITRQQAIAEMRQWMGTSSQYEGLYLTIARAPMPGARETAALAFGFPAARPFVGFRQVMVETSRVWDILQALSDRGWSVDPAHPDVDPVNQARQLSDLFMAALEMEEVQERPPTLRDWLTEAQSEAAGLVSHLEGLSAAHSAPYRPTGGIEGAGAAMGRLQSACNACHREHRND